MEMFSIRNTGGMALLLAGTTWLWLTPAFASRGVSTSGPLWTVAGDLSLLVVAGFCVASFGLFARHAWWEAVALGSAVVGTIALVPYWFAAHGGAETVGTASWNGFVHVLIVAGIFAFLLVPSLERWVDRHVMDV
jgi:dipeptide/tripeptide permease